MVAQNSHVAVLQMQEIDEGNVTRVGCAELGDVFHLLSGGAFLIELHLNLTGEPGGHRFCLVNHPASDFHRLVIISPTGFSVDEHHGILRENILSIGTHRALVCIGKEEAFGMCVTTFKVEDDPWAIVFLGRLEAQKRAWIFCEIAKLLPEYDFYSYRIQVIYFFEELES